MQTQLLSNLEERLGTAWIWCRCFLRVFSRYYSRMLIQICRSRHGESSRERRVCVLVLPNLRNDVKASQDTHHPNCEILGQWAKLGTGFQPILAHLSASHPPGSF